MEKQDYNIVIDSERLKAIRKRAGMTQPEVAKSIGISSAAYHKKETGKSDFNDSEKLALYDLFKMTFEEFDEILYGGRLKNMIDEEKVFLLVPVSKKNLNFPCDQIIANLESIHNAG